MKFPKIFAVLSLSFMLFSCSADSIEENLDVDQKETPETPPKETESENEEEAGPNNDPITTEDYFSFTYEGQEITITEWQGQRSENTISINGWNEDGNNIHLQFNAFGNLSSVTSYSTNFDYDLSTSYEYFKSEYFDFHLVNIDAINKKVEVTFEGTLYEDERDFDSDEYEVQGSFVVTYEDVEPSVSGLGTYAKIDGEDWHATDGESYGGAVSETDLTLVNFNDGEYALYLTFNHETTEAGVYNFSVNDEVNVMSLGKYQNGADGDGFVLYNTEGTLTITEKTVGFISSVKGTFSFTATHPENGDVIQVTEGTFLEVY